ncbi:MAG: 5-dehydro-2-deoxygluconokinase [Bryobacteraceae bacterium]|nr:5-dehydro-2-deoxygluconokinase [Bryobacteraceae bacterium]MDW8377083.1 5-dehydro-2-deoxygluconokinase [Bryobacterales bacterium]
MKENHPLDVVVLGRVGYDLYSEQPNVPLPQVRRFSRYLGGSSANTAVGLSRLGARVGMVSCLGTDLLSEFLLEFLRAEGVDTAHIQRREGFLPSLAFTEVSPPDRFPQVFYRHNAVDTMLAIGDADLDYIGKARMFVTNGTALCASPSRESAYLALERARQAGSRVVLDVDFRPMSWPGPVEAGLAVRLALPYVDVLIANETELLLAAGCQEPGAAVERLLGRGVAMLVAKLGNQGVRVYSGGETAFLAPYPVEVGTTIGAGDGFAAGFLYALLQNLPLLECLHYGNAAAAMVVSRLSCSEAMPRLEEVQALMRSQRKDFETC